MNRRVSSSPFVVALSTRSRIVDAVVRFMGWSFALWMGILVLLQEVLLPEFNSPQRAQIAVCVAIPVALCVVWRRFRFRYHLVVIGPDKLELQNGTCPVKLSPSAVRGLFGIAGLSLDGGEMIVWKKLLILTETGRHVLEFESQTNEACYKQLRGVCPQAWCIPFGGSLQEPSGTESLSPELVSSSLSVLRRHCVRQLAWSSVIAVSVLGGSVWGFVSLMIQLQQDPEAARGLLLLIVFLVAGGLLAWNVLRQLKVLLSLRRVAGAFLGQDPET